VLEGTVSPESLDLFTSRFLLWVAHEASRSGPCFSPLCCLSPPPGPILPSRLERADPGQGHVSKLLLSPAAMSSTVSLLCLFCTSHPGNSQMQGRTGHGHPGRITNITPWQGSLQAHWKPQGPTTSNQPREGSPPPVCGEFPHICLTQAKKKEEKRPPRKDNCLAAPTIRSSLGCSPWRLSIVGFPNSPAHNLLQTAWHSLPFSHEVSSPVFSWFTVSWADPSNTLNLSGPQQCSMEEPAKAVQS
jgi:hypothetical protein